MPFQFFSPNSKRKRYEEQLNSGKDHNGNALSDKDRAYREGYAKAVRESNRIFALKNSTAESREAFKAKRKEQRKNSKKGG